MRPYRVVIFIAAVMAGLGVLDLFGVFDKQTEAADFVAVEDIEGIDTIAETIIEPISEPVAESVAPPKPQPKPEIPKVHVDSTTDSRIFLSQFYSSLAVAGERVVRVVHYGDSQIEEDRMTQQIRERLQKRYGGSGVGLMPLAQTIPTRTEHQEIWMNGVAVRPQQGPRRYMVYAPRRDQRRDGLYGVMGQVAEMNDSLVAGSEEVTAVCSPLTNPPFYTRTQVFADTTIRYTVNGDTIYLAGRGKVYGLSQESDTGVIVDNIPMRGCLGLVFTKIDSAQLASFYAEQNVRLIILQFGGNAIPFNETPSTIQAIVRGLREQVRYIRKCAPEASILFIGPSDMIRLSEGEWQTYPMVPYMDRLLHKMALDERIAYFSLYQWMGGAGSMKRWQEIGLAGGDGVHFYRSGARKAGNAVGEWMLDFKF